MDEPNINTISKSIIDTAIDRIETLFQQLVLGVAYIDLGGQSLKMQPQESSVEVLVGPNIRTEPYFVSHLLPFEADVMQGLLELCQTKLIALWSDVLQGLFSEIVKAHFSGEKASTEIAKVKTTVDLSDMDQLKQNMCSQICMDFSFRPYNERITELQKLQQSRQIAQRELEIIKIHVEIRNAIQHHQSVVPIGLMQKLGRKKITLQNAQSKAMEISDGDAIPLSVPEVDGLKRAQIVTLNAWRKIYD